MRSLVTGAFGFVGNHLVPHLLESGDEVLATYFGPKPQSSRCETLALDVTDYESCRNAISSYKPEIVYQLAGMSFPPDAEKDFSLALNVNVGGTYNVFRACAESNLKLAILQVSSSEIYGKVLPHELPVDENVTLRPYHNYSVSKAMCEMVAQRFSYTPTLKILVARSFNHIGPGQRVDFVASNFAFQLAEIAKKRKPAVMHVGNLDAQRDFSDVRDIVRGYRLAGLKGRGVYNFCSGKPVSIRQILDLLIEISGLEIEVKLDPERLRPSEVPVFYGTFAKAQAELGWEPRYSNLRESLKSVYDYWLAQE